MRFVGGSPSQVGYVDPPPGGEGGDGEGCRSEVVRGKHETAMLFVPSSTAALLYKPDQIIIRAPRPFFRITVGTHDKENDKPMAKEMLPKTPTGMGWVGAGWFVMTTGMRRRLRSCSL